jgi:hypothetical protein
MILCFALTILLALTGFLILVLIHRFKPGAEHRRPASSPPLSTDLDTVDCDADMEIVRVPLPEPTFLSNAAQYSINTNGGGVSATAGESAATIRYPTLGRANRVLRNSHHGGDNGSTGGGGGGGGGSTVSPTPPRDTVVRYSTIGRHRISPNGGGSGGGGNGPMYFGASGGGVSGGMMMYGGGGGAPIYAPGSAYSGVSNHSSYLDADLADPRSLTRSQQSDFPFYD